jgi:outer membrane protein assembly factor BamE (lipoprotein component of BamABCDE complex)
MNGWLAALLITALITLSACDPRGRAYEDVRLTQLTEGQSTEQDVRRLFGPPHAVREGAGGKGLVYPLGPEGSHTLLMRIDAQGRYQGREDLLTRENFNRVQPGQREADVVALLGPPGRTQQYALKQQNAWEWRFLDGTETRLFVVMFDAGGNVVSTATEEDPRRIGGK